MKVYNKLKGCFITKAVSIMVTTCMLLSTFTFTGCTGNDEQSSLSGLTTQKIGDINPSLAGKSDDERVRTYLTPTKVIWTSNDLPNGKGSVEGADNLLKIKNSQISFMNDGDCTLRNDNSTSKKKDQPCAAVLLDFGTEIQGSVRIYVSSQQTITPGKLPELRIRFGESVSECMAELGENNTTNDHANRDFKLQVNSLSANETNCSGFRFVRIDLLDKNASVSISQVEGVFIHRDLEYKGTFKCSDDELNKIWDTAAYTVHLNMQEYLWDGVKRDRLVWVGDMHPEVMTITKVFGDNDVVRKSLDMARDTTPLPGWMNGMSSYSLWWVLIHYDWYMYTGDKAYLDEQRTYLKELMQQILDNVGEDGHENLPDTRFLDWPNNYNPDGINAGLQGLTTLTLQRGAYLLQSLGGEEENSLADKCLAMYEKSKNICPDAGGSKQGAAMEAWAGNGDALKINEEILKPGGAKNYSTFMGYYILTAKAMADDYQGAIDDMKAYWGGMLQLGATTFWEDFNIDWLKNAARIDEIVPKNKVDVHGSYGGFCYAGFRHSLCHGWSSGPVPWLSENVLGVKILEPGCTKVSIEPHLGNLEWAEGTVPTPLGIIKVSHKKQEDGSVKSDISVPDGVEVVE